MSVQIPRLASPIPSSWVTEEADYILVHAAMCSNMQAGAPLVPFCALDEKLIYLVVIRYEESSRLQVRDVEIVVAAAVFYFF